MLNDIKSRHMHELAEYRKGLREKPSLKFLFLELTLRCNESCIHCGSRCGEVKSEELPAEVYQRLLDKVAVDFRDEFPMLCVTGGEPLLRKDFFEIMSYAHRLGFLWGMTSNGTLIDEETAAKLCECGMSTISVSIDGLRDTHDKIRRTKGGYDAAMRGVDALIRNGGFKHIQVTSVINHQSISELDALYDIMCGIDIDSWRVLNIEPIGRARENQELLLAGDDYRRLFDFIRSKRQEGMPVTYGCSHYLGPELEREVRDWYFICNAGIYTASVMANGDIGACLDIERRSETVQGNILRDDFTEVWRNRFEIFRSDIGMRNEGCRGCESLEFCGGGACHSWDYDRNEPLVCFKNILF